MNEHEKDDDWICTIVGITGMGIILIGWLTLAATIVLWILSGNEKTFHSSTGMRYHMDENHQNKAESKLIARRRSWWQQIQQYRRAIGVVTILLIAVVVIALIIAVVLSNVTGFNGYNKVSTVHTISGPSTGTVTRTEEYQPGKTLWDWMQLLIVPVVLAIAGFWLSQIQKSREERTTEQRAEIERKAAEQRAQTEREIAIDNQRETALQEYLDKMSELLFEKNLRKSKSDDEVRTVARARTLAMLRTLDADRKGSLLQFLYEARLINKDVSDGIIDLSRVDLTGANLAETDLRYAILYDADLGGADLSGADLSGTIFYDAYLRRANLSKADLSFTNLTGADLSGANLTGADLSRAKLFGAIVTTEQLDTAKALEGATMPDGSTHP